MEFSKSVFYLIKLRRSIRSYDKAEIRPEDKKKIIEFIKKDHKTIFGSKLRFEFIDASGLNPDDLKNLGTYGFISGAKYFIVGAVIKDSKSEKNYYLIDYGYVFEKIILFLTDLNLGTCWLGGTFNKKGFSKKMLLKKDEVIPAISPTGIILNKKVLKDSIIKKVAGSNYRKAWDKLFFKDSFSNPLSRVDSKSYKEPLEMVRLSPSASNLQPWRIIKEKDKDIFHFFIQRSRYYKKSLGRVDLQFIDMGIALRHFDISSAELNLGGKWKLSNSILNLKNNGFPPNVEYLVSWIGS